MQCNTLCCSTEHYQEPHEATSRLRWSCDPLRWPLWALNVLWYHTGSHLAIWQIISFFHRAFFCAQISYKTLVKQWPQTGLSYLAINIIQYLARFLLLMLQELLSQECTCCPKYISFPSSLFAFALNYSVTWEKLSRGNKNMRGRFCLKCHWIYNSWHSGKAKT